MLRTYKKLHLIFTAIFVTFLFSCSGPADIENLAPEELYKMGMENYTKKKYLASLEDFKLLVFNYPGSAMVDSAQFYLAMSYFGNEDYILAEHEFNRLQLNYPSSPLTTQSQFMRAVCFFEGTPKNAALDQQDLSKAIGQFEDFIIDHPESDVVPDARAYLLKARTRLANKHYMSGMVYERIRRYKAARTYFQRVVDEYTSTEYASLASFQLAELEYKSKKFNEAARLYENFITVFPDHKLVPKAQKRLVESSFCHAENTFKTEGPNKAKPLFEEFVKKFSTSKKVKKAKKYLAKITEMANEQPPAEEADSAAGR